jgi:hypothetical protein
MRSLPQFSTRHLLGLMFVAAIAFTIIGLAVRGQGWAIGVSSAMAAALVMLFVFAALFGLLWALSAVGMASMNSAKSSVRDEGVAQGSFGDADAIPDSAIECENGKDSAAE